MKNNLLNLALTYNLKNLKAYKHKVLNTVYTKCATFLMFFLRKNLYIAIANIRKKLNSQIDRFSKLSATK